MNNQTLNYGMDIRQRDRSLLLERFSQAELQGCYGICEEAEALLQGGSYRSTPEKSTEKGGNFALGRKQEAILEEWAKAKGIWYDNSTKYFSDLYGEMYAQGGESTVYLKNDGRNVVKEIELAYYVEPHLALDRVVLHNAYVGLEAPLSIIGFGRNTEGNFVIMVEQPFIQGETITLDEIYAFMTALGFPLYRHKTEYTNGDILLNDVHDENVLKTPDGHYVIIDADFRLNTCNYGVGGLRRTSSS